MPKKHVVEQGEHISGIAASHGFAHYKSVWDDPANADLKALRKEPHQLLAGDEVSIPDPQEKIADVATAKIHPFKVKFSRLILRIQALDYAKKPIAGAPCKLSAALGKAPLETNDEGKVEAEIAKTAKVADFSVGEDEYAIRIGFLDPIAPEEEPGWAARLTNLGYFVPVDAAARDDDELRSAVEEFQCDFGLKPIDGKLSAKTKDKLVEVHGS